MSQDSNSLQVELQSASEFQILNVLIHRSEATTLAGIEDDHPNSKVQLRLASTVKEKIVEVHLPITVIGKSTNVNERNPLPGFELSFCALGLFKIPENATKKEITSFARHISLIVLLPYAREHVTDTARRMGIQGIHFPIFSAPTVIEGLEKGNSISVKYEFDGHNPEVDL